MEDPYPIENIDRLGVLMFQNSDIIQLLRSKSVKKEILASEYSSEQVLTVNTSGVSACNSSDIAGLSLLCYWLLFSLLRAHSAQLSSVHSTLKIVPTRP